MERKCSRKKRLQNNIVNTRARSKKSTKNNLINAQRVKHSTISNRKNVICQLISYMKFIKACNNSSCATE